MFFECSLILDSLLILSFVLTKWLLRFFLLNTYVFVLFNLLLKTHQIIRDYLFRLIDELIIQYFPFKAMRKRI